MTVGKFSIEGGILSGPKQYMEEKGNAEIDGICKGEDAVFNMTVNLSPNVETAILVHLQTDYAGWLGFKEMLGWTKGVNR